RAARVAILWASGGSEISGPAAGGGGGVFTKYIVDGVGAGHADANSDGKVSLQELYDWVKPRVAREARRDNRDQNPTMTIGSDVGDAATFIVASGLKR